jgi:hypothetical protein
MSIISFATSTSHVGLRGDIPAHTAEVARISGRGVVRLYGTRNGALREINELGLVR